MINYYEQFGDLSVGRYFEKYIPILNAQLILESFLANINEIDIWNPDYPVAETWLYKHYTRLIKANKVDSPTVQAFIRGMDYCLAIVGMSLNERLTFYKLMVWRFNLDANSNTRVVTRTESKVEQESLFG